MNNNFKLLNFCDLACVHTVDGMRHIAVFITDVDVEYFVWQMRHQASSTGISNAADLCNVVSYEYDCCVQLFTTMPEAARCSRV